MGPNPAQVNAKCDVVMKLSVFGTRTDTHIHTRHNLYFLTTLAVIDYRYVKCRMLKPNQRHGGEW